MWERFWTDDTRVEESLVVYLDKLSKLEQSVKEVEHDDDEIKEVVAKADNICESSGRSKRIYTFM